jgi:hypothetical protein
MAKGTEIHLLTHVLGDERSDMVKGEGDLTVHLIFQSRQLMQHFRQNKSDLSLSQLLFSGDFVIKFLGTTK